MINFRCLQEFNISILEKGTEYQQEVDLDEDDDIVTVHVPAHNDIDETYFITDIEKVRQLTKVVEQPWHISVKYGTFSLSKLSAFLKDITLMFRLFRN